MCPRFICLTPQQISFSCRNTVNLSPLPLLSISKVKFCQLYNNNQSIIRATPQPKAYAIRITPTFNSQINSGHIKRKESRSKL